MKAPGFDQVADLSIFYILESLMSESLWTAKVVPVGRLHAMAPSTKLHDIVLLSIIFPRHAYGLFAMLQPFYAPAWGCTEHKALTKR